MKLYLAATTLGMTDAVADAARVMHRKVARLLFSFHYFSAEAILGFVAKHRDITIDAFIDSGAFSADTQGATITVKDYSRFITALGPLASAVANLDVIGNPKASRENLRRLEGAGHRVVPVFHFGSPWSYLEEYVTKHRYVALGGMVGVRDNRAKLRWVVECHRRAKGSGVRFHAFGNTSSAILRDIPFFSADASSWSTSVRYGRLPVLDRQKGTLTWILNTDWKQVHAMAPTLRRYGIDPHDLCRRHGNVNGFEKQSIGPRLLYSAVAMFWYEDWLNDIHRGRETLC